MKLEKGLGLETVELTSINTSDNPYQKGVCKLSRRTQNVLTMYYESGNSEFLK